MVLVIDHGNVYVKKDGVDFSVIKISTTVPIIDHVKMEVSFARISYIYNNIIYLFILFIFQNVKVLIKKR
jgi:hypothetical protein